MVGGHRLSTVCDDIIPAFDEVLSKRVVLQRLLSTVCGDLLAVFEQTWSGVTVFELHLSRVCGFNFVALQVFCRLKTV